MTWRRAIICLGAWVGFWLVGLAHLSYPISPAINWEIQEGSRIETTSGAESGVHIGQALVNSWIGRGLSYIEAYTQKEADQPGGEARLRLLRGSRAPRTEAEIDQRVLRQGRVVVRQSPHMAELGVIHWSFEEVLPRTKAGYYLMVDMVDNSGGASSGFWLTGSTTPEPYAFELTTEPADSAIYYQPQDGSLHLKIGRHDGLEPPLTRLLRRKTGRYGLIGAMIASLAAVFLIPGLIDRLHQGCSESRAKRPTVWFWGGLVVSIGSYLAFRCLFEYFPTDYLWNAASGTVWDAFTPGKLGVMLWSPSGLGVSAVVQRLISPEAINYFAPAVLIGASYLTAYSMSGSLTAALTLAVVVSFGIPLAFSTYFHATTIQAYFLLSYVQINLLAGYKLIRGTTKPGRWKLVFAVSLVLAAAAYEMWLNYFAFLLVAGCFLLIIRRRIPPAIQSGKVIFMLLTALAVCLAYGGFRIWFGVPDEVYQTKVSGGGEEEMWLRYDNPAPMIDDFISNELTYLYAALTRPLPPLLVNDLSIFFFGRKINDQNRHEFGSTTYYHHLFQYRYLAGAAAMVFFYFLIKMIRCSFTRGDPVCLSVALILLLILTGHSVHSLIKFRDVFFIIPKAYKYALSALGAANLIAFLVWKMRYKFSRASDYFSVVLLVWGTVIFSAFFQPQYLIKMISLTGHATRSAYYPDPIRALLLLFS